jgi:hypothetical protein
VSLLQTKDCWNFFPTFDNRGEEAGGEEKEKEDMIRKEAGG